MPLQRKGVGVGLNLAPSRAIFSLASVFHCCAYVAGLSDTRRLPARIHTPSILSILPQKLFIATVFILSLLDLSFLFWSLLISKNSSHHSSTMSGVVHHLISRGIDATQQGWTAQSLEQRPEGGDFRMPPWGFAVLWITALLYVGGMFAVSPTYSWYSASI